MKIRTFYQFFAAMAMLLALAGCTAPKGVAYFQDAEADLVLEASAVVPISVVKGDKLSIVVKSKDPVISDLFNLQTVSSRVGTAATPSGSGSAVRSYSSGAEGIGYYTVNQRGEIDFPVLGTLNVLGMTRSEVSGFIKGELEGRELAKDVVVTVEFINAGVSVFGEVLNPGRYDINKDELTILDAITLAGDLTIQGQRENVKVIRRESDGVHTYVVDLTDMTKTMKSPAYYLRQNDVVYVEPNGVKKRQTTVNGNTALSASFWVSVASLLTSVAVLIFK